MGRNVYRFVRLSPHVQNERNVSGRGGEGNDTSPEIRGTSKRSEDENGVLYGWWRTVTPRYVEVDVKSRSHYLWLEKVEDRVRALLLQRFP